MLMNNKVNDNDNAPWYILDSTVIIHILPSEETSKDNEKFLIPFNLKEEMRSTKANLTLSLLESEDRIRFVVPSSEALSRAKQYAEESGDFPNLSTYDIDVIALYFDYPESVIISDDKAVQNVCVTHKIPFKAPLFKIKSKRKYYWKCIGCGGVFQTKIKECQDCGSALKRKDSRSRIEK